MKLFFTSLIICLFGLNFLVAQNKSEIKTDRERESLRGAVKKVETYLIEFLPADNGIVEQKRPWVINSYNVEGNRSEQIVYLQDGNVHTDVYIYNAEGKNVECRTYSNAADKTLDKFQRYIHKFDDNGNMIERIVTESGGSLTARFVYKYDARGNKIEERNYYHTGALGGKIIFTYNDDKKITSQTYYQGENSLSGKSVFIYNKKQNTEQTIIYQNETLRYKILFSMDDKGRILQKETSEFNAVPNQWTSHAPEPGKVIFIYDDERKTKEEIEFNTNGFMERASLYAYDEKDNEIERIWYESGSSFDEIMQSKDKTLAAQRKLRGIFKGKIIYRYEYDAQGNWTKKTRLYQSQENEQPKPQSAEYRIISYH
jgi:hypothetical protein